jgi:hypothetical protein
MSQIEEENNRLFIDAYGLQDELSPEVPDDQITLYRPDREEDIKRLISYAIGCMMGRYSLDKPGLILANQGDSIEEYLQRTSTTCAPINGEQAVREPGSVVFAPDADPHCFRCDAECDLTNARFVVAAYDKSNPLFGRPLIYCAECCEERHISFHQPLAQFSVSQAIERNWCEPTTLQIFLELAGCFVHNIPRRRDDVTFMPDDDGIIPLLETDWGIRDDATNRFIEFVGAAWPGPEGSRLQAAGSRQQAEGSEDKISAICRLPSANSLLEENLKFVADSLGPTSGEQPRDTIRRYLAVGFYKHHLSMYKKRPIYWLFSSGKQRAFQCLVYLHRYHEGTLARMRTEYVIPLQGQIAARIEQLEGDKAKATSTSHRKKLQKEQDDLKKQEVELRTFEEKLKHAADQKITLDLDDGVKLNYAKFGDLLAESKAICGNKDDE